MIFFRLFFEFFKVGLFAVGGGAATIPFLSKMSEATGWFTKTDLANMIAISESTPGPIGVNMSTYVGFLTGKIASSPILGSFVASLGLITPSIIISLVISGILKKFRDNLTVKNIFYGLKPASTGLIAAAAFEIVRISLVSVDLFKYTGVLSDLFNVRNTILFVLVFVGMKKIKVHPVIWIGITALIGAIFQL